MSKFETAFSEPMTFSDCTYVLSGSYSKEEAAEVFSNYLGEDIKSESLEGDRVRFGFPPAAIAARGSLPKSCWYSGAGNGKGTKPVWVWG